MTSASSLVTSPQGADAVLLRFGAGAGAASSSAADPPPRVRVPLVDAEDVEAAEATLAAAAAQAEAGAEVQGCRFRPQPHLLIQVRLQGNPLGEEGFGVVAQALQTCAPLKLHSLNLSACGAGDGGGAARGESGHGVEVEGVGTAA